MKKLFFHIIAVVPFVSMAQSAATDSVKVSELDEIVVEARTQRVIDRGVEYIPTNRIKKSAGDAVRLLELMNIPQLDIIPGSMSVKTYTGKDVGMFIDYKAADEE